VNVNIPISGAVFNPCNAETATFSGIDHFTASVTFDRAGGSHMVALDNIHVTATGSLGNSYEGNEGGQFSIQWPRRLCATNPKIKPVISVLYACQS
jgi:hypothetical protein